MPLCGRWGRGDQGPEGYGAVTGAMTGGSCRLRGLWQAGVDPRTEPGPCRKGSAPIPAASPTGAWASRASPLGRDHWPKGWRRRRLSEAQSGGQPEAVWGPSPAPLPAVALVSGPQVRAVRRSRVVVCPPTGRVAGAAVASICLCTTGVQGLWGASPHTLLVGGALGCWGAREEAEKRAAAGAAAQVWSGQAGPEERGRAGSFQPHSQPLPGARGPGNKGRPGA